MYYVYRKQVEHQKNHSWRD